MEAHAALLAAATTTDGTQETSVADTVCVLKLLFASWLDFYCPRVKATIGSMLFLGHGATAAADLAVPIAGTDSSYSQPIPAHRITVYVETLSGQRLAVLTASPSDTILAVSELIAKRAPAFPVHDQQLCVAGTSQPLQASVTVGECMMTMALAADGVQAPGTAAGTLTIVALHFPLRWDVGRSNRSLEFSLHDTAVRRPATCPRTRRSGCTASGHGAYSSSLSARTAKRLHGPGDGFSVRIASLKLGRLNLSVGVLADGGQFPLASSDGVGTSRRTAGVCFDNLYTRLLAPPARRQCVKVSGRFVGPWMDMFAEGDLLGFQLRIGKEGEKQLRCVGINSSGHERTSVRACCECPVAFFACVRAANAS
jgi:hypothetical protein